ncbi:MAG: hypothetical protein RJA70_723 [Pseudomonadota bacterium]|jgi:hypothetical protein
MSYRMKRLKFPRALSVVTVAALACSACQDGGSDENQQDQAGRAGESATSNASKGAGGSNGPGGSSSNSTNGSAFTSAENIRQNTQAFDVGAPIAPTQRFTVRTNGLCGQSCRNGPRHIYTATYGDKLLVSWMAVDPKDPFRQYGNVATFTVSPTGEFALVKNVSFEGMCKATYGISTNSDGSVIGVLCRGEEGDTSLLPGAVDVLSTKRTPDCTNAWESACYPIGHYYAADSPMYLLEYSGAIDTNKPKSTVLINHSVGGWNFGHNELKLNAAGDTYFVHLKVTAGPSPTDRHEGMTYFALRRAPSFEYVPMSTGWSCGAGHVLANRMAYSPSRDTWSEACQLDLCPNPNQYKEGACQSISFTTVPGVTETEIPKYDLEYLLQLDLRGTPWTESGGISTLLSLGADGWLALAAGPGYVSAATKPDTIGLLQIPATMAELRDQAVDDVVPVFDREVQQGEQKVSRYPWNWLYLPEPDPALGRERRVGMAAMAYFDTQGEDSQRLLVGWSPTIMFQGIASEYVVSEIDREGRLRGQALRLKDAGWGEDNLWATMPESGCVVFPFAWVGDAPGGDYPIEAEERPVSDYPTKMQLTSLCPGSSTQPPLAPVPPAIPDRERWK